MLAAYCVCRGACIDRGCWCWQLTVSVKGHVLTGVVGAGRAAQHSAPAPHAGLVRIVARGSNQEAGGVGLVNSSYINFTTKNYRIF